MGLIIFPQNKVFRPFSNVSSNYIFFVCCIFLTYLTKFSLSEDCSFVNNCKCKFRNGSVIDLTSLGYHGEPRWKDIKPVLKSDYKYSYDPCFKFSMGNGGCDNVQVCQTSIQGQYFDCGNEAHFGGSGVNGITYAVYNGADGRRTNVSLVCSPQDVVPRLNVTGEITEVTPRGYYEMALYSRCACADLCREDHLSAGSVLVIIFMIFVALYLVLGIIHSSLTRGAHGWELIPHYEFWVDFPLLVRDGCVFVISGCKPETAYERI